MGYVDFSVDFQDMVEDSSEHTTHQPQHFAQPACSSMQDQARDAFYGSSMAPGISCDVKPRLSKDQLDILESHYQNEHKPNTCTKKGYAALLGVSLDKVNNWFQNRRAKNKQDLKKAQSTTNLFHTAQPIFETDSEPSPFHTPPEYGALMQQWSAENQMSDGLGISQMQPQQANHTHGLPFHPHQTSTAAGLGNFGWSSRMHEDMYDSPHDVNRRTLTQEAFDAISQNGGMVDGSGNFEGFQTGFSGDQDILNEVFPDNVFKQQEVFFPYPSGAPLGSHDSTVPSISSDQSLPVLPPSIAMQAHADLSSSDSEWADSRSSSLSTLPQDSSASLMPASYQHPNVTTSQWQPGQSVPVDFERRNEEFRQAIQARSIDQHGQSFEQPLEQPLAFPTDEAYTRRNSQASLLVNSMGAVGISTPHSNYAATFKSPAPPSNIAARRQRPRPAMIGVNALRSQSHSDAGQPSPVHSQHQSMAAQDQHIRRIRSAVAMNGGVAHGRVMKSTPGSAQRSPLNWTFQDALNSPNLARNLSSNNLQPPTPMSPREFPQPEAHRQASTVRQSSSRFGPQPNISETDLEYSLPYHPAQPVPAQTFSSPPHTPMYYDHSFFHQQAGGNVFMVNTPPQSAPAGQTSFPNNLFGDVKPTHLFTQAQASVQQHAHMAPQPQQYAHMMAPHQKFQISNVTFAPNQEANVTTGPPPGVPLHFTNGVPTMNAEGTAKISFPSQVQLTHQQSQRMQTPPQPQYSFPTTSGTSDGLQATAQPPKQAQSELFVHEYTPSDAMKRAATPRKHVDNVPRNYSFTHTGPEYFEEKQARRNDSKDPSISSVSPANSAVSAAAF